MKHHTGLASLVLGVLAACGNAADAGDDVRGGSSNEAGGQLGAGAANEGGDPSGSGGDVAGGGSGGEAEGGAGGCQAPDGPKPFELGTGEECFERIADGDVVPLIQGPQGGYHVWLAFGCEGCSPTLHARFGVNDPETGVALPNTHSSEAIVDLEGTPFRQYAGIVLRVPGISWDPENFPPPAQGARIELWAELIDEEGEPVTREEREVEIGETVEWNPCKEEPELPECQAG